MLLHKVLNHALTGKTSLGTGRSSYKLCKNALDRDRVPVLGVRSFHLSVILAKTRLLKLKTPELFLVMIAVVVEL